MRAKSAVWKCLIWTKYHPKTRKSNFLLDIFKIVCTFAGCGQNVVFCTSSTKSCLIISYFSLWKRYLWLWQLQLSFLLHHLVLATTAARKLRLLRSLLAPSAATLARLAAIQLLVLHVTVLWLLSNFTQDKALKRLEDIVHKQVQYLFFVCLILWRTR